MKKELVLKTKCFKSSNASCKKKEMACLDKNNRNSTSNILTSKSNTNYENEENVDDNENDDTTCSICMYPIVQGDKIGVIRCNHLFHIDCLKLWLQRSNVCSLCMDPDVAKARIRNLESSMESVAIDQV